MQKYYTIYKTTNLLNGKFYLGKHETDDPYDHYMGSGIALLRAIKKYGRENFIKQVLYIFDTQLKMNLAERILVVVDFETTYNLGRGGEGGPQFKGRKHTVETKLRCAIASTGRSNKRTPDQIEISRQIRLANNNGKWVPDSSIEKFRLASLNQMMDADTRQKISSSMKAYYLSNENREKHSKIMKEIYDRKAGKIL